MNHNLHTGQRSSRYSAHYEQRSSSRNSYNRYSGDSVNFGEGSTSPRMPKRSTKEEGWYKAISKEMGTPRSPTPILKNRNSFRSSNNRLTVDQIDRAPSPVGRPMSVLSQMSVESRNSSRANSPQPEVRRQRSVSPMYRSFSTKSVDFVGGPVSDMIINKKAYERAGQQEYYRGRDASKGKVSHNFRFRKERKNQEFHKITFPATPRSTWISGLLMALWIESHW